MTRSVAAIALLAWGFVDAPSASLTPAQQESRPRATGVRTVSVTASVVDAKGMPVSGLTIDDFRVREDNVEREVLKVGPNTEPMQIALLVDDSQAATNAVQPIREGLTDFVNALQGKGEIALITVGERPTSVVQYTPSAEALTNGINRIFPRRGAGAYLVEAISEASRGLQKRNATRPVIVALTTEGVEFGSGHYEEVLRDLYASKATLHVIAIGSPAPGETDEMRNRNMIIAEGTDRTGGRRDQVLSAQAIPERLRQLAAELTHQYLVTYSRPDTLIPPERVRVSVRNPTLTVRANTMPVVPK